MKFPSLAMEVTWNPFQIRSTLADPPEWLQKLYGIPTATSEIVVTERNAMTIDAVYAAVRIISEDLAKLPWPLYRRLAPRGKERARDHRVYGLIHDQPNEQMTSFIFRRYMQGCVLLWGNAYAEIQSDGAGRPIALWPLPPDKTWPKIIDRDRNGQRIEPQLLYETDGRAGGRILLSPDSVFHVKGLGDNPYQGVSVITYARRSLELMLGAEEYGTSFFARHQQPSGVFVHPKTLSEKARAHLKDSLDKAHGGAKRAFGSMLLEEGIAYHQLGMSNADSQFLESRKFGVTTVARWFRLKPHKLGDLERATFSNIESEERSYLNDCLMGWLVQWEQEANTKLLGVNETQYFSEFLVDGLLRGDFQGRMTGYATARQWGWMSANDIRELEGMNPIGEQGDLYLVPLNMIPADKIDELPAADAGGAQRQALLLGRISAAHMGLLTHAAERMVKREADDLLRSWNKADPKARLHEFHRSAETFYRSFPEAITRTFLPLATTFAESVRACLLPGEDIEQMELGALNAKLAEVSSEHCARSKALLSGAIDGRIEDVIEGWHSRASELCQAMFAAIRDAANGPRAHRRLT